MAGLQEYKNTEKKIFDELYLCRIPNYKTMSADYLKIFGTPTTFNNDIDNQLSKELLTVMIPISKMVEYFQDGIVVRIVKAADTKLIYENIQLHLTVWRNYLERGLNTGNAPMDDLIALDQFASAVYPHATAFFTPAQVDSLFSRQTAGSIVNNSKIIQSLNKKINNQDKEKEEIAQRESLADFFKDKSMGIRKWQF